MWQSELYTSLMRSFFLEDEPVNIFVCGCGCVGCGDTEVHIDETKRLVIWHDFIQDSKTIEFNQIFVFDREQYYSEVNKILEWVGDTRLVHYLGNDVLHDNLPLYNIRRRIDENAKCFEDGSRIIYVNSQRRDDTALGKLMQDLYCTEPKNLHYHEFAERMEFLKYSKEGEEKMTDVIEEYAARKAEAAAKAVEEKMTDVIEEYAARKAEAVAKEASEKAQARNIELAKDLLSEGESIERTVRLSKLSEAEVRELASKLTA